MKLRAFLNALPPKDQADFATRCGTSLGYLRKAISINQRLGHALCVAIERESDKLVTRQELRDDWQHCWPELSAAPLPLQVQSAGSRQQGHPEI